MTSNYLIWKILSTSGFFFKTFLPTNIQIRILPMQPTASQFQNNFYNKIRLHAICAQEAMLLPFDFYFFSFTGFFEGASLAGSEFHWLLSRFRNEFLRYIKSRLRIIFPRNQYRVRKTLTNNLCSNWWPLFTRVILSVK